MNEPIVCILPEPPSANVYWRRHGHVLYRTREATAYCERVAVLTRQFRQNGEPSFPSGDVSVNLIWHRGRKAGDLDNRSKILYDALEGSLYADDAQIAQDSRQRVDDHPTIPKAHVRVEVGRVAVVSDDPFPFENALASRWMDEHPGTAYSTKDLFGLEHKFKGDLEAAYQHLVQINTCK